MRRTLVERFWSKVARKGPDECWPWLASTDKDGYGVFSAAPKFKSIRASRMCWILEKGDPGVLLVLHRCDNPPCCNPRHLFLGTAGDNARDMCKKGRNVVSLKLHPELAARGEENGNVALTERQVREIRRCYVPRKVPLRYFAEKFGVAETTIHLVVKGGTWRHVD